MTGSSESVVTFPAAGIFGAGRLASRLKELEGVDLIGPWHVGHWIDYTHSAIRIRFSSPADARTASINVGPPSHAVQLGGTYSEGVPPEQAPASKRQDGGSPMVARFARW